ncbi:MAG: hypothetical protein ACLPJJ_10210 [Acidocella sp.]|uniref:hypothetical protein n=1 Tax=Acidocella sp. TaxID=50710 RepID=UPI003FBE3610
MNSIRAFLQSPTNRTGLAIWLGTAMTAVVQYFVLKQTLPSEDFLGIILGFVKIVEPETAVTVAQMETAIADAAQLIRTKNPAEIEVVAADMGTIAAGVMDGHG